MSGVTDVGMRRVRAQFGASLVVSEMVASDDFVRGDEETRLRAEGEGLDVHVVQIAGCDPAWMGEAARLAEGRGRRHRRHQHGLPGQARHGRLRRLRADARLPTSPSS